MTLPSEQHAPERADRDWDAFILHVVEDRDEIVGPLAEALGEKGLAIWYDDLSVKLGDGLLQSMDRGLAHSAFGMVVLSKGFFAQHWPVQELDSLATREANGRRVMLPIWRSVGFSEVCEYSPTLADRLAVSTDRGIANAAERIVEVIRVKKT
ncbi:MAG: toll/interleukin-1 receptor domain-containing protein [Candidatus Acidiferrales bacterium]